MSERRTQGQFVWVIGLGVNGGLAIVKLVAGLIGNSFALIADAVESLGDIFASVIVLAGLVVGSRPPDKNHPYGHGKAEPLAALAVAVMLIVAAVGITWQALAALRTAHEPPAPYTLVVLFIVIVVKESMYRFASRAGRRIESSVIEVDAWHHRSDALTSLAAAFGITLTLVGGSAFINADEWAAMAACAVIAFSGGRFAIRAIRELMDTAPQNDVVERIVRSALSVDDALAVEKVMVRKMGGDFFVDMHLEVEPTLTVGEAHALAHAVKNRVMGDSPRVLDVLVHVEPFNDSRRGRMGRWESSRIAVLPR